MKLYQLIEEVLGVIRDKKYEVKNVHVKLRFSNFKTLNRQQIYSNLHLDTKSVYKKCLTMIEKENPKKEAVRLIGMGFDLKSEDQQLDIFSSNNEKVDRLNKTKDVINQKFGKNMISGAEGLK